MEATNSNIKKVLEGRLHVQVAEEEIEEWHYTLHHADRPFKTFCYYFKRINTVHSFNAHPKRQLDEDELDELVRAYNAGVNMAMAFSSIKMPF